MLLPLLFASSAFAGSGPWTVSAGDLNAYVGANYQRFAKLAPSTGSYGGGLIDVDEGVENAGAQLILGFGLRERLDAEVDLPWQDAQANRTDGAVCTSFGLEACDTTKGIGVVTLRGKGQLLDELTGAPLSLSVGPELRFGQLTAPTRARITNLGEGTTDVGLTVAAGRAGALGNAYASGYVSFGARYRFPNVDDVPGSEVYGDGEFLVGGTWWTVGPTVLFLDRPEGVDVETIDLADVDRFGALHVVNVRAGGKVILRADRAVSFALSAYGTVYAVNNPSDTLLLSAGVSVQAPAWKSDAP